MLRYYYVSLTEQDLWIRCKDAPSKKGDVRRYPVPDCVIETWENHTGMCAEVLRLPGNIDVAATYLVRAITADQFNQVKLLADKLDAAKTQLTNSILHITEKW